MKAVSSYPEFDYKANQLLKFISACDFFTIMLKTREIIHYRPADKSAFMKWLMDNNIEDIREHVKAHNNVIKGG